MAPRIGNRRGVFRPVVMLSRFIICLYNLRGIVSIPPPPPFHRYLLAGVWATLPARLPTPHPITHRRVPHILAC